LTWYVETLAKRTTIIFCCICGINFSTHSDLSRFPLADYLNYPHRKKRVLFLRKLLPKAPDSINLPRKMSAM